MFLFSQSELKRFKLKLSVCRREFSLLVSLQAGGEQPLSRLAAFTGVWSLLNWGNQMKPLLLFTLSASNNSGPVVSSHFVIQLAYNMKFSAAAFESVDSSKAWCWFVFKGSRFGFRTALCLGMQQHIQAVSRVQRPLPAQLIHSTASAKKGGMLQSSGKHTHNYLKCCAANIRALWELGVGEVVSAEAFS